MGDQWYRFASQQSSIDIQSLGDLINEFVGYNNADVVWKGAGSAGQILPTGTYFYVLELFDSGMSKVVGCSLIE